MKDNYSIFLVDDDPENHLLFQEALNKINVVCKVTSLYNGTELIDLLFKRDEFGNDISERPDFVVLDLNMPLLNGFDALKKIRSNTKLNSLPIYVLSASHDPIDRKKSLDMGATGFYLKDHSNGKLQRVIAEILISL